MKHQLRPRQEQAIEMIRNEILLGNRSVVLQAVCGFGKTVIASYLMESVLKKGKRAVFICDQIKLIDQCAKRLSEDGIEFGVIQAAHPLTDCSKSIQVASIQTIRARKNLPDFDMYIVDECHCWHKAHIELMKKKEDKIWLGLSATPWTKGLGKYYKSLVIPCTNEELLNEGLLVPLVCYGPSKPDLSKVRTVAGDYEESGLSDACNKPKLVGSIVEHWLKIGEDRKTIAFAVNVAHSLAIVQEFNNAGISAAHIDGYMVKEQQQDIIYDFENGRYKILSSVNMLSKGVDFPSVSCGILARPTKSRMMHEQQIGRLGRIFEGKIDSIILDHAGNIERPEFCEPFPIELDDGKKKESKPRVAEKEVKVPKPCPKCFFLKTSHKCPKCGFAPTTQAKDIEATDGQLTLLKGKKKKAVNLQGKQSIYSQLLQIQRDRGYSSGWLAHKYREYTGVWPKNMKKIPMEAGSEIRNFVRSQDIRFYKGKK